VNHDTRLTFELRWIADRRSSVGGLAEFEGLASGNMDVSKAWVQSHQIVVDLAFGYDR